MFERVGSFRLELRNTVDFLKDSHTRNHLGGIIRMPSKGFLLEARRLFRRLRFYEGLTASIIIHQIH